MSTQGCAMTYVIRLLLFGRRTSPAPCRTVVRFVQMTGDPGTV
ncbi:hypothetical protein SLI_7321 [Streptomyces lividans 1326]|uniref:Uncharacterized protein n=1 Tax=Streptomyces lividans 1326 TaxID=1200984 RepID=A0A7U9E0Y5_STRLI|nr:hypothetical protein SLI_7321 [Streptomyces lividans 1326]